MSELNLPSINRLYLKDLQFGFGEQNLFENLSYEFNSGEVVRVFGPGGVGTSTFLRLLAGLLRPQKGSLYINDLAISDLSFEEFAPLRKCIGYSFEMGGLLSNRTLKQNLSLPLEYHGWTKIDKIDPHVDLMLRAFELDQVQDVRPSAASGTQRKALCVARALVMNPQVLILDEPTIGLNNRAIVALEGLIDSALKRGDLKFVIIGSSDKEFLSFLKTRELALKEEVIEPMFGESVVKGAA